MKYIMNIIKIVELKSRFEIQQMIKPVYQNQLFLKKSFTLEISHSSFIRKSRQGNGRVSLRQFRNMWVMKSEGLKVDNDNNFYIIIYFLKHERLTYYWNEAFLSCSHQESQHDYSDQAKRNSHKQQINCY